MFAVEKQIRADNITNPLTAFHLFDALVAPVLLHGCETWGCYGKAAGADVVQLSCFKRVECLPPVTDTITVLAESGWLPMQIKLIESQARFGNDSIHFRIPPASYTWLLLSILN